MARRNLSFRRVVPAMAAWKSRSSRMSNRGPGPGQQAPRRPGRHTDDGDVRDGQHPSAFVAVRVVEGGELGWVATR